MRATASGEMRRFRNGHVVAQIALSLMLLVGAGLLMRGFVALGNTDPGLDPEHVLTAMIAVPHTYAADGTETQRVLRPLLERVRAIPGVRAAGLTSILPIDAGWHQRELLGRHATVAQARRGTAGRGARREPAVLHDDARAAPGGTRHRGER